MIPFQQPQGRPDHFHHLLGILRFEKTDDLFLVFARRRPGEVLREPAVDLQIQVLVLSFHHLILNHLHAHTEDSFGIHGIFRKLESLNPAILVINH